MALRKKASAASRSRVGDKRKAIVWPALSLPKPGCHHPGSAPEPCMRVGPSHGSSVICPLSQASLQTCELKFRASPLRGSHTSYRSTGSWHLQRYSLRPSAYHRPHVSLSAGFPGSLGFLGNPFPLRYTVDTSSSRRTRQGDSVPGRCLALRAGPHCSPGDVVGCSLEHAVSCPAGESCLSLVSMSVLDQAHNLRRLVVPDDDSSVSSSAYPLRNSARRDAQGDSAGPPFALASPG